MSKINFELLREAAAIINGIPGKRIHLDQICQNDVWEEHDNPSHCGTFACWIGFLAMHPKFKALGLGLSEYGEATWYGVRGHYAKPALELFGLSYDQAVDLFGSCGLSTYDESRHDHKAMIRNRVRCFLKDHGQPINPDY